MLEESLQSNLLTRVCIPSDRKKDFVRWQSQLQAEIASFEGFVSLEIISPKLGEQQEWKLIQHFETFEKLEKWRESAVRKELFFNLEHLVGNEVPPIQENSCYSKEGGVTEVFVTQVNANELGSYHRWIGKIHEAEAKFAGFQRVYVQAPRSDKNNTWITLLQFDTAKNLDRWLHSKEREEILHEAQSLVKNLESHRVISPFAGWFAGLAITPPVWKQTLLVLLVLFPIVMLEFKFLAAWTAGLNLSLATFIGNAISVSLVSWPMMPIVIYAMRWWLTPFEVTFKKNIVGILTLLGLYFVEIIIFWN
jgi:uncharacterized protein